MLFQTDIVRGVRLAAILLVALLLAVTIYRILPASPAPAPAAHPVPAVQQTPVASPADPEFEVAGDAVVGHAPVVPPPPPNQPVAPRAAVRKVPRSLPQAPPAPTPSASVTEGIPHIAAPAPDPGPAVRELEVAAAPAPEGAAAVPPAPSPPLYAETPAPARQDAAPKRILKAVGRFFRIGPKKDVQPESARKP